MERGRVRERVKRETCERRERVKRVEEGEYEYGSAVRVSGESE